MNNIDRLDSNSDAHQVEHSQQGFTGEDLQQHFQNEANEVLSHPFWVLDAEGNWHDYSEEEAVLETAKESNDKNISYFEAHSNLNDGTTFRNSINPTAADKAHNQTQEQWVNRATVKHLEESQ